MEATETTGVVANEAVVVTEDKPKPKRKRMDDTSFIRLARECKSVEEFCKKSGMSAPNFYVRKQQIKKRYGINIGRYGHVGKSEEEIASLRALAAELGLTVEPIQADEPEVPADAAKTEETAKA